MKGPPEGPPPLPNASPEPANVTTRPAESEESTVLSWAHRGLRMPLASLSGPAWAHLAAARIRIRSGRGPAPRRGAGGLPELRGDVLHGYLAVPALTRKIQVFMPTRCRRASAITQTRCAGAGARPPGEPVPSKPSGAPGASLSPTPSCPSYADAR